jgi:hypothetical protein
MDAAARDPGLAVSGQSREDVRARLDAPLVASAYWNFDVFRRGVPRERRLLLLWMGLPFASVPAGKESGPVRFTLVVYDAAGRSVGVDHAIVLDPAMRTAGGGPEHPALRLRVGDMLVGNERARSAGPTIFVTPALRDRHFTAVTARRDRCILVVGCGGRACPNRYAVDHGVPADLPLRTVFIPAPDPSWLRDMDAYAVPQWFSALVALGLAPGMHTIAFSAQQLEGEFLLHHDCGVGELSFVLLDPDVGRDRFVDWRVAVGRTMPPSFSRLPLVLMKDGRWIEDAEQRLASSPVDVDP